MSIAFQFQVYLHKFTFNLERTKVYFFQSVWKGKTNLKISKLVAKKLDVNFAVNVVNHVELNLNLEAFICWCHA